VPTPLPAPLAFALERAIAALLAFDPDTAERLARLDGRVVRLVVRSAIGDTDVELALSIVDGHVDVFGAFDGEADVSIAGTVGALRSLSGGNDALYTGEVKVEGDLGVAQGLSELVSGLDVDLEEIVAPVLGGTLARRVGVAGRDARAWAGRTRAGFRANVAEYLEEESELLTTRDEVERFGGDVDELRAAADRLEARIRRFERGRAANADGGAGTGTGDTAGRAGTGDR